MLSVQDYENKISTWLCIRRPHAEEKAALDSTHTRDSLVSISRLYLDGRSFNWRIIYLLALLSVLPWILGFLEYGNNSVKEKEIFFIIFSTMRMSFHRSINRSYHIEILISDTINSLYEQRQIIKHLKMREIVFYFDWLSLIIIQN